MKKRHRPEIDYTGWTKEQHIEHLKKEEAYQKIFEKMDARELEPFMDEYATFKAELYPKKEEYVRLYEQHHTQFLVKADAYIDKILQKKLFNLQCKWRANLIQLPLIHIIDDFDYWEDNIRSCPFIPPITQKEIDLCIRFLKEEIDWDDNDYGFILWQNYEGFKYRIDFDNYSEEEKTVYGMSGGCNEPGFPALYNFFDKHQKTDYLMSLTDVREPIEKTYRAESEEIETEKQIALLHKEGKWADAMLLDENGVQKPMSYFAWIHGLKWAKFVEKTEDQQTKELFKQAEYVDRKAKKPTYIHLITVHSPLNDTSVYYNFLQEFDDDLPIEAQAGDNWRVALERTARKFQQIKIADMLLYAYDTYLLEFEQTDDIPQLIKDRVARFKFDTSTESYETMIEYREFFLNGREALTGKRDFDYL